MTQHFYIGVDGGATKCIVRLEDESGRLLGQELGGPANIRLSVDQAWQSINSCLNNILSRCSLDLMDKRNQFHAGMGLAGCEVVEAYQDFVKYPHGFAKLVVVSDSHAACLGAHGGEDGAIIVVGTGVVGFQAEKGGVSRVGGWGFPHDDEGGGAWLGLQAVRLAFQWLDGRQAGSELAKAIYGHFGQDQNRFVSWANQANSTAFAELAPIVILQSKQGDQAAIHLLEMAASEIDRVGDALESAQKQSARLPCALVGGIAPFVEPYLQEKLRSRLRPCLSTPDAGAILLVRQQAAVHKEME